MNKIKNMMKSKDDFKQLQTSILLKTAIMLIISVVIIYTVYEGFLNGRFANVIVDFFHTFFFDDYEVALEVYQRFINNYMDLYILIAILAVFLVILRIYLKSFTKYFKEINRGIDSLIEEDTDEIVLTSGLSSTASKLNSIKHTLEQRRLTAEIAEKRKNDLIVYVAHDLKTPLTSVIGYLTLLRDEGKISEELREKYLSISLEKAERLEDLINEFFEITRYNIAEITPNFSIVNLTRLLEQLTFEFKPMLTSKNLHCNLEIEQNVMIRCDADKMQRVFENLLRNAVNYCFENSMIQILVLQDGSFTSIRFINSGTTITQEKLERIFEQFYRLDSARSTNNAGAGLGLAIAKEIVKLHNGTITAKSDNETIEFEVCLPADCNC